MFFLRSSSNALNFLGRSVSKYYLLIIIILVDQLLGFLAVTFFRPFIKFNSGFAFGASLQMLGFNISRLISLLIVGIFTLTFIFVFKKNSESTGFKLVLAGALSNLMFRIFYYGYVVDYLSLQMPSSLNWQYVWFNIGDISVVVGAVLMVFGSKAKQRLDP